MMKSIYRHIVYIIVFASILIGEVEVEAIHFKIEPLSDALKEEMKTKGTWKEECPVGLVRLRLVKFSYYDFNQHAHDDGEIVVLDAVSQHVLEIFKELYNYKFPLAKARRIEHYDGSDDESLADNNSSSFNFREITGGGMPSLHSYGLAIDINPIQNPFIAPTESANPLHGLVQILPAAGLEYLNRQNIRPGMVEPIVEIFKKHGFKIWGGQWNNPIDWQHFQLSRAVAQLLAAQTPEDAKELFEMYVQGSTLLDALDAKQNSFVELYKRDSKAFMQCLKNNPALLNMDAKDAQSILTKAIFDLIRHEELFSF